MTTNAISPVTLPELSSLDLAAVCGGAGAAGSGTVGADGAGSAGGGSLDMDAIRSKAQRYCPDTADKYANVKSSSLTRTKALRMGNECLAEMGSFAASFARGPMMDAINDAFPRK